MVAGLFYTLCVLPIFFAVLSSSIYLDEPPYQISSPCHSDRDCVKNAYCSPKKESCYCNSGYVPERNRTHKSCLEVAQNIGDPCTHHVQCRVSFGDEAECRESVCQCSEGTSFDEGRCYKIVGLGEYCVTSRNCYVEGSQSFCVTGFCACPLLYHPSSDLTRCLKDATLGDPCASDEDCVDEHSRCTNVCVCNVDHVPSRRGKRCLKAASHIGDVCEEDRQCQEYLPHSHCKDGKCSCIMNFHRRGSLCIRNVALGQPCNNTQECVTPSNTDSNTTEVTNVLCNSGVCECAPNYIITENACDCIGYSENGVTSLDANLILSLIAALMAVAISIDSVQMELLLRY